TRSGGKLRLGQETRVETVGLLDHLSLRADVDDAALAVERLVADFFRLRRSEAAVVPRELDARHVAARRELIVRRRRRRIADAVEWRRARLDHRRHPELQRPERMID